MTTSDDAAFYDAMWQTYGHLDAESPAAFHRRRLVVDIARERAPGSVLDAGAGPGELVRDLARALPHARIAGSDLSDAALVRAREACPRAEFFAMDLTAPDFDEQHAARLGSFAFVVSSEVLEHLRDPGLAAGRLAKLLAPGGTLVVTVPGGAMSRFDVAIGHQRHYSRASLRSLLEGAGLRVERVIAWGFPFHSIYRTAVRVASRVAFPTAPRAPASAVPDGGVLGSAYVAAGRLLRPLFYLNASVLGEQLIATARR